MNIWEELLSGSDVTGRELEQLGKQTRSLKLRLARSHTNLRESVQQLEELEEQVAGICLFNRTLLRLLIAKGVVSPKEFAAQFDELDMENGHLDGR